MGREGKSKHGFTRGDIVKFSILVAFVAAGIVATIALWPTIMWLTTQEGIQEVAQIARDSGPAAVAVLLGLQLLQVIIAFIPGEVVQIAAGMLFGPLWGALIILFGAFLSTVIIYYLVHKLGASFVAKLVKPETQEKFDFITRTRRIDAIVFVLFLIPGLPKDAITYLIALTDVRPSRFFLFSTLGRIPGVIASSFAGTSIIEGNWMLLAAIALVVAIALLIVFLKRQALFAHFDRQAAETSEETNEETSEKMSEEMSKETSDGKDDEASEESLRKED